MSDQPTFNYDVFISYSSQDKEWVRNDLLARVERAGLSVFIDFRDFKRGAPSLTEMERGISICRKTLIILTPNYMESGWCEIENIMLQTSDPANHSLRLIPLLKTPCQKPPRISILTHIDFTEGADVELAWHQLFDALELKQGKTIEAVPIEIQMEIDRAKGLMDSDNFSDAIPILEKVMTEADVSGNIVARVKVRSYLAQALYEVREDFFLAERHYKDALALVPIDNFDLKHDILHGLGSMMLCSGRLDEANATILAAMDVANKTGKTDDLVSTLISLSMLKRALGFNDIAIAKLDEAVQLLYKSTLVLSDDKKKKIASMLAICFINRGLLYQDAGNLDEALEFFEKAEVQHRISGDKLYAGKALLFCGEVHCQNADWEKGFDCFNRALEYFKESANPLWGARCLEHIARLYATHDRWDIALPAMLGAIDGAKESGNRGEQVHFLCLTAQLLRKCKTKIGEENIARIIQTVTKSIPEEQLSASTSSLLAKMREMSDALNKAVREDEEVRNILNQAKEIAQRENLHQYLSNCLIDEAHNMTPPDDTATRRNLILQATELLKKQLQDAQSTKKRGHLMGRISALYHELGEHPQALLWLKKSGDVFEKSGDAYGIANTHVSLAQIHHAEGGLNDEITAYRKTLSIAEGRSFHYLATGARINLAAALRCLKEFSEAQRLIKEAEVICNRHHFKNFISTIAQIRSDIEDELRAKQAPSHTLPQLLDSFNELLVYAPDHGVAYLPFWYFAWKTELLALLCSGSHLSFMVVTDNVERFMRFTKRFSHLAEYFLMGTSQEWTVKIEKGALPIPPSWHFPASFPFLFAKRDVSGSESTEEQELKDEENDVLPSFRLDGPAKRLPEYMMITVKSGEGHMMCLSAPYLPQAAIDLMVCIPISELIKQRAIWCPVNRSASYDPFYYDLQFGCEHGVFPVYFDHLPTSDKVIACGDIKITIPGAVLCGFNCSIAEKWGRSLLKLTKLPKDKAQAALFDLSDVFAGTQQGTDSTEIEIRLFEFTDLSGQRRFHLVILVQD